MCVSMCVIKFIFFTMDVDGGVGNKCVSPALTKADIGRVISSFDNETIELLRSFSHDTNNCCTYTGGSGAVWGKCMW